MTLRQKTKILGRAEPDDFVGREAELERLLQHSRRNGGHLILAPPSCGTSELLRQAYDRLFADESGPAPFYFEIKRSDITAENAARRFLSEFVIQTVAFGRREPRLLHFKPTLAEIRELAGPAESVWVEPVIESLNAGAAGSDEQLLVRNLFASPLRAAAASYRSFLMIDGLDIAAELTGGAALIEELSEIFVGSSLPFVFAGLRRSLFAQTPLETVALEPLSFPDTGKMIEALARNVRVAVNDQTRDLISVQLSGNLTLINHLIAGAAASGRELRTFEQVEQVYTDQVFGGRIGKYFDEILERVIPDKTVQLNVLGLLFRTLNSDRGRVPLGYWQTHAALTPTALAGVLEALRTSELIDVSSGVVHVDPSNIAFADYLRGRVRLEIDGDARALAVGDVLSENIRRAPELMARHYRRGSALGLREMLLSFNGQQISPALIDYGRFKDEFKGSPDEKVIKALKEDNAKITLPQIVYTAHTGDFYSKLNELCDIESSAVALGFTYAEGMEGTAWIAAEIESKLEASSETVDLWCERLEMAAVTCKFERYKLWLISREGFSPEAMAALRARSAYGSSRKQVEMLAGILGAEIGSSNQQSIDEYEFVFPMGENTEMIAANTVEEIARRHAFPSKAINQIKTALVEACINAAEHSMSPDRKIYQKLAVGPGKITITVSNRGVRLTDKVQKETSIEEGRRGWGLNLIRSLMDELEIARVDDGTQITMVKYLNQSSQNEQPT